MNVVHSSVIIKMEVFLAIWLGKRFIFRKILPVGKTQRIEIRQRNETFLSKEELLTDGVPQF